MEMINPILEFAFSSLCFKYLFLFERLLTKMFLYALAKRFSWCLLGKPGGLCPNPGTHVKIAKRKKHSTELCPHTPMFQGMCPHSPTSWMHTDSNEDDDDKEKYKENISFIQWPLSFREPIVKLLFL